MVNKNDFNSGHMSFRSETFKGIGRGDYLVYFAIIERPALSPLVIMIESPENHDIGIKECSARLALSIYHSTPTLRNLDPENIEWVETDWLKCIREAKEKKKKPNTKLRALTVVTLEIEKLKWHWEYRERSKKKLKFKGIPQIMKRFEDAYLYYGGLDV